MRTDPLAFFCATQAKYECMRGYVDKAHDMQKEQNVLLVDTLLRNFGNDIHQLHMFIDEVFASKSGKSYFHYVCPYI